MVRVAVSTANVLRRYCQAMGGLAFLRMDQPEQATGKRLRSQHRICRSLPLRRLQCAPATKARSVANRFEMDSDEDVRRILLDPRPSRHVAEELGVHPGYVRHLRTGRHPRTHDQDNPLPFRPKRRPRRDELIAAMAEAENSEAALRPLPGPLDPIARPIAVEPYLRRAVSPDIRHAGLPARLIAASARCRLGGRRRSYGIKL